MRQYTTVLQMSATDDGVGVVLAGGRSRRMGRDKALLEWQGRTLLDHAIARFRDAGFKTVVVSGDRPEHGGLRDLYPDAGPLSGLHAAACAFRERWLVAVSVDMPRLPAQWLRLLARQSGHADAAHYAGTPLPLAMRTGARTIAALETRLRDPSSSRALYDWLQAIAAEALPLPAHAGDALMNVNTPSEWETMRA